MNEEPQPQYIIASIAVATNKVYFYTGKGWDDKQYNAIIFSWVDAKNEYQKVATKYLTDDYLVGVFRLGKRKKHGR